MWFDALTVLSAADHPELLAPPVAAVIDSVAEALVFVIDPSYADTEALCTHLELPMDVMANAVLVTGRRAGDERNACCMTLAHRRVDVNSVVRRRLDVRKASFASMDKAVSVSGMEYGGITPIGLPADWPVWVDGAVADTPWVCIGSGVRRSKLIVPGQVLVDLPGAERVDGLARDIA